MIQALIVEDEAVAMRHLKRLIAKVAPDIVTVITLDSVSFYKPKN